MEDADVDRICALATSVCFYGRTNLLPAVEAGVLPRAITESLVAIGKEAEELKHISRSSYRAVAARLLYQRLELLAAALRDVELGLRAQLTAIQQHVTGIESLLDDHEKQ